MKPALIILFFIYSLFLFVCSCQFEKVENNTGYSSNSIGVDNYKDTISVMEKVVFLDTSKLSNLSLEQLLANYSPKSDIQFDLDKANWGGDDRVLLRNYFTDKDLFPVKKPNSPIVIREIVWQVGKDSFKTCWFRKIENSWTFICESEIYQKDTEF